MTKTKDYKMLTSLMTYFHDLRDIKVLKLGISPFNLVKNQFQLDTIDENLLKPEDLTRPERAAQIALDLAYEIYKTEQATKSLPFNQNDFQFRYLATPEGHKVYEACISNALTKLSASVTLEDLKRL